MKKMIQPCVLGTLFRAAATTLMLVFTLCVATIRPSQAQTFTTLHTFSGSDGNGPRSGVVLDSSGNIYGTTEGGGVGSAGVVYELDTTGQLTVLYSFMSQSDGSTPFARVIRDKAGNLYGTAMVGGNHGKGTAFKVGADSSFTTLHSFGPRPDGTTPRAGLVRDAAGNLYGVTSTGGSFGKGTVYKLDASGNETVLYNFAGGSDGMAPTGDLIRDSAGNLYGTTKNGGAFDFGTVFKLDSSSQKTILYNFGANPHDGSNPVAGLVMDAAGNFYGTTVTSVDSPFNGTVFKLDPSGNETILKNFNQTRADGKSPDAGVALDANGNLFGVCSAGGSANEGTAFMITASGQFKLLINFGGANGGIPEGKLVLDGAGNLYGTTLGGGGTIFKISR